MVGGASEGPFGLPGRDPIGYLALVPQESWHMYAFSYDNHNKIYMTP